MLARISFFTFLLSVSTVSIYGAAIVTCSQPGSSNTTYNGICSVGTGVNNMLMYHGFTTAFIFGGEYDVEALAEPLVLPSSNVGPYPMSGSATWSDFFAAPSSKPTDILKITVTGGGLNHPASIQAGPIDYTTPDFCDAHFIGNPVCTKTATVSAASFTGVILTGSDSITIPFPCVGGCGVSVNADLFESVTIQRFLSDGVTPDPFTISPEPGSLGLLLLAIPLGVAFRRQLLN
jgi:hypothetical protein